MAFTRRQSLMVLGVAVAIVAGCGGDRSMMPLEVGTTWSYETRGAFASYVDKLSVNRRVSIASVQGYELSGPMGISRLAWIDGRLVAERTVHTLFDPPIPLLDARREEAAQAWKGEARLLNLRLRGTGRFVQEATTVELGGRKVRGRRTTLTLEFPNRTVELETSFAPGVGIVRQVQRTNGKQDASLEWLAGPQ